MLIQACTFILFGKKSPLYVYSHLYYYSAPKSAHQFHFFWGTQEIGSSYDHLAMTSPRAIKQSNTQKFCQKFFLSGNTSIAYTPNYFSLWNIVWKKYCTTHWVRSSVPNKWPPIAINSHTIFQPGLISYKSFVIFKALLKLVQITICCFCQGLEWGWSLLMLFW